MVRQSVVVLLGSLAKFLEKDDSRVTSIFNKLLSAVSFPADVVSTIAFDSITTTVRSCQQDVWPSLCRLAQITIRSCPDHYERIEMP